MSIKTLVPNLVFTGHFEGRWGKDLILYTLSPTTESIQQTFLFSPEALLSHTMVLGGGVLPPSPTLAGPFYLLDSFSPFTFLSLSADSYHPTYTLQIHHGNQQPSPPPSPGS